MSKDIVYPYVQETLKPSKNFEDLMAEWKKIGLPRNSLLELYNRVWSYKQGDQMQTMLFDMHWKKRDVNGERARWTLRNNKIWDASVFAKASQPL